ncbi:uncharacterized protein Z518_09966 [Rhinocladiella mackenziei CBS 650.93]|uniref:Rhinocladiella mackenziei CBS 650.93 unplaced genomic scaffold supercont1.8, whole genome shotgun sequence n=1 Tax=Rhinocladiella mackenziei CBS 650.93 TaxID=1442369 RepID=A0A0D2ICC1_9EURO|nr:uncharacterized protein Z518_09966 [Rhinocladiella mackenziei CBS 650.93]KIX00901.1 hypothetical protein Z518_09966 [Rhinocladiella mackenziei CBS 650.93]
MRTTYLTLAAFLQLARAQDSTTTTTDIYATDSATTTATTSQAITQTVAVGRAGHTFEPDVLQVGVGNYVAEFDFYPTNHSVIRAEYEYPCVPYELTGVDKVGFFSGFQPVDAILADPPKWTVRINDTNPIFFYCGAPNSCIGYQMVGVINPNASTSLEVQKQYAANSTFMLLPGEDWPDEADPLPTTSSAYPGPTSTASSTVPPTGTATPAATETAAPSASSHTTLSAGAIAGIAIGNPTPPRPSIPSLTDKLTTPTGGAAVVIAAAALLFFCGRKSRRNEKSTPPAGPTVAAVPAPPAYVPPNNYGYDYRGSLPPPTQNKHMSVTTAPLPMTDAFGNPTPTGYMPGPYPTNYMPGQPGHPAPMQQNPLMGGQSPWPQSPSNDIFGAAPPAMHQSPHETQPLVQGTEANSMRASSPSSVNAAPIPATGGIEAFLQRQARMSPVLENELHGQQSSP